VHRAVTTIWAQKHFAYAHNIRYVMLCLYILRCLFTIFGFVILLNSESNLCRYEGFSPFILFCLQ